MLLNGCSLIPRVIISLIVAEMQEQHYVRRTIERPPNEVVKK